MEGVFCPDKFWDTFLKNTFSIYSYSSFLNKCSYILTSWFLELSGIKFTPAEKFWILQSQWAWPLPFCNLRGFFLWYVPLFNSILPFVCRVGSWLYGMTVESLVHTLDSCFEVKAAVRATSGGAEVWLQTVKKSNFSLGMTGIDLQYLSFHSGRGLHKDLLRQLLLQNQSQRLYGIFCDPTK